MTDVCESLSEELFIRKSHNIYIMHIYICRDSKKNLQFFCIRRVNSTSKHRCWYNVIIASVFKRARALFIAESESHAHALSSKSFRRKKRDVYTLYK